MIKKPKILKISKEDKINYILENETIQGKVREFINRFNKIEISLEEMLDSIIKTKRLSYKDKNKQLVKIRNLLDEMERYLNEPNTRKDERNTTNKS